jgi:hypothetical protein
VDLTTDDDYVGFWAENDGVIDFVYNVGGGTDIAQAAEATVLAGEFIHFGIKFDQYQQMSVFINGRPINCSKSFAGNQTALLLPFVATLENTSAGADPKISVIGMAMSKRLE